MLFQLQLHEYASYRNRIGSIMQLLLILIFTLLKQDIYTASLCSLKLILLKLFVKFSLQLG
jgi:hypothetical protein